MKQKIGLDAPRDSMSNGDDLKRQQFQPQPPQIRCVRPRQLCDDTAAGIKGGEIHARTLPSKKSKVTFLRKSGALEWLNVSRLCLESKMSRGSDLS
jgi:hypothetical protein